MKILVAVDRNPYSSHAVEAVAKLAANTWANVTLLAVQSKNNVKTGRVETLQTTGKPVIQALLSHWQSFLSHFDPKECPYASVDGQDELKEISKGVYEVKSAAKNAKKKLRVRLRTGTPAKEILAEAKERESDLIVLACDVSLGCAWGTAVTVPRKVANEAACSVLIAKSEKKVKRMVCCLDHYRVSQASLEMINQMVTLHGAKLAIAGLAEHETLKTEVERKLDNILRYYHERGIDPWIELVDLESLDAFIAREARWGLMALWMGKQSILEMAFPKSKVNKLIKGSDTSVLILR
jgi:nucleotide-binding universal stress UspA family protein